MIHCNLCTLVLVGLRGCPTIYSPFWAKNQYIMSTLILHRFKNQNVQVAGAPSLFFSWSLLTKPWLPALPYCALLQGGIFPGNTKWVPLNGSWDYHTNHLELFMSLYQQAEKGVTASATAINLDDKVKQGLVLQNRARKNYVGKSWTPYFHHCGKSC